MLAKLLLVSLLALSAAAYIQKARAPSCILSHTCPTADWRQQSHVTSDTQLTFRFAVKNANMDSIHSFIARSSTSPRWLTKEEVRAITNNDAAVQTLQEWLIAAGFTGTFNLRNEWLLEATASAKLAEHVFRTTFFHFTSAANGMTIQRALSYSLPEDLAELVDFVDGTVQFPPTMRTKALFKRVGAPASNQTTPALLNSFYHITTNKVVTSQSTQSLFESLGQSYSSDDLFSFESKYSIPKQDCSEVIGPNSPNECKADVNDCVEANLDVQYIIAIAQTAPTTYWSIANYTDTDPFLEWVLAVEDDPNAPYVHSISYGGDEQLNDHDTELRVDDEISKLAARGITVMVSSGDDGVAGSGARHTSAGCGFNPTYPGQLPHVTSVGATMGIEYNGEEIACTSNAGGLITTGGGFSTLFTAPDWQADITAAYIKNGPNMPPTNKFASTGRGYPDVSMAGHNYVECVGGKFYEVSGTSASTPVFAGLITLINGQRINVGKKTLGWITPTLYTLATTNPDVFNDITVGENNCAADGTLKTVCCQYGFTATKGWDPVTGLGSVNYDKLSAALLALP